MVAWYPVEINRSTKSHYTTTQHAKEKHALDIHKPHVLKAAMSPNTSEHKSLMIINKFYYDHAIHNMFFFCKLRFAITASPSISPPS